MVDGTVCIVSLTQRRLRLFGASDLRRVALGIAGLCANDSGHLLKVRLAGYHSSEKNTENLIEAVQWLPWSELR